MGLYSGAMNKTLFKKITVKDKAVRNELIRAHTIIVLLSVALIFVLLTVSTSGIVLDMGLSIAASVFLLLVAIFSLSIVLYIAKKSK